MWVVDGMGVLGGQFLHLIPPTQYRKGSGAMPNENKSLESFEMFS